LPVRLETGVRASDRTSAWRLLVPALLMLVLSVLGGCSSTAPPSAPLVGGSLQQATTRLTDTVLNKALERRAFGGAFGAFVPQAVSVAPVVDARNRLAGGAGTDVGRWIGERVTRSHPAYFLKPFRTGTGGAGERWQLRASLGPVEDAGGTRGSAVVHQLVLDLVDVASGAVVASASERLIDPLLDRTAAAPARDKPVSAAEREETQQPPNASTLQAWTDEYLSLLKRGRDAEAQVVFGRIVAAGLSSRNLGVRLLFAPGTTDFWPDPALTRQYAMWLAEIARQLNESPYCLQIVGHSSRKGSEEFNRKLSSQRAQAVKQVLLQHAPALGAKLETTGVGWAQTIVGSGSDDQRDAADRRVEFKVVDCP
jgi:outer membrane protein OmpA-like peptidoglycan-associated protein